MGAPRVNDNRFVTSGARTLAESVALAKRAERRKDAARLVGVLVLVVGFLYVVLFGAVKVIKMAGG